MRRYWIPPESVFTHVDGSIEVHLAGDVLHHIRDVCRQSRGSRFEVIVEVETTSAGLLPLGARGQAHLVEIVNETKRESIARVISSRWIPPLPEPRLHLALSIPRLAVLEAVVEKAVELGVKALHPFYSDHSFVRTQTDVIAKKRPRIQKIIQSATQQSGRGELMEFHHAVEMKDLIEDFRRPGQAQGLFAYEGQAVLSARQGIENMRQKQPREVWAFVGSEGGFSLPEVQLFQKSGLQPVTLGGQVLRVETACVATISIIKYGFDLMRVE